MMKNLVKEMKRAKMVGKRRRQHGLLCMCDEVGHRDTVGHGGTQWDTEEDGDLSPRPSLQDMCSLSLALPSQRHFQASNVEIKISASNSLLLMIEHPKNKKNL